MIASAIIRHLLHNNEYRKKVMPFFKPEYFTGGERVVFEIIQEYTQQYGEFPSLETVRVDLTSRKISDSQFEDAKQVLIDVADPEETTSLEWLTNESEKFCQESAVNNALMQCIQIKDGKDKKLGKGAIPQILADALAVSFDINLGHDYFTNAEDQLKFYHDDTLRIPFGIPKLDLITNGGLLPKTINVFMAPTGVGKTLVMTSLASGHLAKGKSVLYFTMEISENEIRKRIDANLLDIDIERLNKSLSKEKYMSGVESIKQKCATGRLVIKEYASGFPTVDHFQHFLNELRLKLKFIPDIIYVDYLNICASSRVKHDAGSYSYVKNTTQELRSFAQKNILPVVSATQTNRGGYNNADIDMDDISDSFGTGMELDLLIGITQTNELKQMGQYAFKQIKSRYGDPNKEYNGRSLQTFVMGVDKSRMRIHEVEDHAQTLVQPARTGRPVEPVAQTVPVVATNRFAGFK